MVEEEESASDHRSQGGQEGRGGQQNSNDANTVGVVQKARLTTERLSLVNLSHMSVKRRIVHVGRVLD